jgi:soluble lytic murein transglycosylase
MFRKCQVLLCFLVLSCHMDFAWAGRLHQGLETQRSQYEQAKRALKSGDMEQFQELRAQLSDYPLAPYLDYQQISRELKTASVQEVDAFLSAQQDSYLEQRLRSQYLVTLAGQKRWQDYLYFHRENTSTSAKCAWLYARISTGDLSALNKVGAVWQRGKSQPKACDPLFELWLKSDAMQAQHAWTRFYDAMQNGRRGLANYSSRFLSNDYSHYVELMRQLDSRPHLIRNTKTFKTHSPEMQQVIAFGIEKYARYAPVEALNAWYRYEAKHIFDDELSTHTKSVLVRRLINKGRLDLVKAMLERSPGLRRPEVVERMIRGSLKAQRWQDVLFGIDQLPEKDKNSDRWRYWAARAQVELGIVETDDEFKFLSTRRSYYGFLSADRLNIEYSLANQSTELPQSVLDQVSAIPAIRRAKELRAMAYLDEAYAEWMYGIRELSARELTAAAILADSWGWHDRAIQAMIVGEQWNQLNIRFPLAYREAVQKAASETRLPEPLIYAVVRQESAMWEQARSSAGAVGLMQLMPSTARQTARKNGIEGAKLTNAEHNLRLGSHYLDELLKLFSGNRILAAAAYNAGPHRVKRWISPESTALPFDVWIETIPFRETRGYVQNVLTFSVIYSYRMGEPGIFVTPDEAKTRL